MTAAVAPSLSLRLREATRLLHRDVERSALMQQLLRGTLARADYCRLLSSLHTIYAALESALAHCAQHPQLAVLPLAGLQRRAALAQDLDALHGRGWAQALPAVAAATAYAGHLQALAGAEPARLAAHAYVRYLGDLNGGQALSRIVARAYALAPGQAVAFYDFGAPDAVAAAIAGLRDGLDRCALDDAGVQTAIVAEAVGGFERHGALFAELLPAGA